jgi:hypothetical protein
MNCTSTIIQFGFTTLACSLSPIAFFLLDSPLPFALDIDIDHCPNCAGALKIIAASVCAQSADRGTSIARVEKIQTVATSITLSSARTVIGLIGRSDVAGGEDRNHRETMELGRVMCSNNAT